MKRRFAVFGAWTVLFVLVAGTAVAVEGDLDDDDSTEMVRPVVTPVWDDEAGVVIVSIGDGETDPCDGVTYERDMETGELVITVEGGEDGELPAGCIIQDGTGPNGQRNHGTMVSAVARNVSPHDLDVPKGWIIREIAKLKPDKVKPPEEEAPKVKPPKGDDDDDDRGVPKKVKQEKKDKKERPEKAPKVKKEKKPKKNK